MVSDGWEIAGVFRSSTGKLVESSFAWNWIPRVLQGTTVKSEGLLMATISLSQQWVINSGMPHANSFGNMAVKMMRQ